MRLACVAWTLASVALALAACTSSSDDAAACQPFCGSHAGYPDGDAPANVPCLPVMRSDSGCNTLEPTGSLIDSTPAGGAAPGPIGGPLADGVYLLDRVEAYGGRADTQRWVLTVTCNGTLWQSAVNTETATYSFDATGVVQGTTVSLTPTCGDGSGVSSGPVGYTADGDQLTLFAQSGAATIAYIFKRR